MRILIDVWSDYVCPFCWLEIPVLDQIAEEFGESVDIRLRAYELRPEPVPTLAPDGEYLRDIWTRVVYPMAEERGMLLRLPPVQPRSRLAHEAAAFAGTKGKRRAMQDALFRAFFEDGKDIGDAAVLGEIAAGIGLSSDELLTALTEGRNRQQILAEEELAADMQLTGVPAIVMRVDGDASMAALQTSGAQPVEVLRAMLLRLLGIL